MEITRRNAVEAQAKAAVLSEEVSRLRFLCRTPLASSGTDYEFGKTVIVCLLQQRAADAHVVAASLADTYRAALISAHCLPRHEAPRPVRAA